MAIEVTLPRQSEKLDESLITFWHISEGDWVEAGDPLVEVQTEKAVTEIEAPESGVVKKIIKQRADTVSVGEVLAILETDSQENTESSTGAPKNDENVEQEVKDAKKEFAKKATPRVKKLAKELGVDWKLAQPSGKSGKVTEEDVRNLVEDSNSAEKAESVHEKANYTKRQVLATPSLRKFARENNLTVEEALRSYIFEEEKPETEAAPTIASESKVVEEVVEQTERRSSLTGIRKAIARGMVQSRTTIPHVTHFDEANVAKLVDMRETLKKEFQDEGVKLTYLAFVVKAFTAVLSKYPYLNASFDEEQEEIVVKENYHIGFAADTERGLLVPVIKQANHKSLFQIAEEIQDLAVKAKEGTISPDEMTDGTATISNVGSAQGSFFTPIINPPQSSILGLGRIEKKAIVTDDDTIEIQPRMALSLSYDHRLIDGVMAQEAMNELKEYLSKPELLLAKY